MGELSVEDSIDKVNEKFCSEATEVDVYFFAKLYILQSIRLRWFMRFRLANRNWKSDYIKKLNLQA